MRAARNRERTGPGRSLPAAAGASHAVRARTARPRGTPCRPGRKRPGPARIRQTAKGRAADRAAGASRTAAGPQGPSATPPAGAAAPASCRAGPQARGRPRTSRRCRRPGQYRTRRATAYAGAAAPRMPSRRTLTARRPHRVARTRPCGRGGPDAAPQDGHGRHYGDGKRRVRPRPLSDRTRNALGAAGRRPQDCRDNTSESIRDGEHPGADETPYPAAGGGAH